MPLVTDHGKLYIDSTEGYLVVGKGFTAEVRTYDGGRVVKLFESWVPDLNIEREYTITRAVHASGFPVPAAYELVEIGGRRGIVLERIEGMSMLKGVQARPWTLFGAARQLAELHAQLHGVKAPGGLPSLLEKMAAAIEGATSLSVAERQAACECLGQLPKGDRLCHGDFHPENILLPQRGPVVIDWMSGTSGHPLGDVATTSLLFDIAGLPETTPFQIRLLFKVSRRLLHAAYLKRYFQLRPGSRREILAWRPALMAGVAAWRERQGDRRQEF